MDGRLGCEGHARQAVGLQPDRGKVRRREEPAGVDDAGRIGPVRVEPAAGDPAAKEQVDLVVARFRIVEFVDERQWSDLDRQPAFLVDLTDQVLGQRPARLDPAAGRAPEVRPPARIGVDEQEAAILDDDRAAR